VPAIAAAQAALGARVGLATLTPQDESLIRNSTFEISHFPATPGPLGSIFCFSPCLAGFVSSVPARVVHAHGLWLRPLHYAASAARRRGSHLVVAPRGMLEPWALAHKAWKKRLAAALLHPRALAGLAGWHATAAEEADHLRALPSWLGVPSGVPACIAPNGIAAADPASAAPARAAWLAAYPQLGDKRVALFYGRFHRKKRVAELIGLWRARPRSGWTLLVAGLPGDHSIDDLAKMAGEDPASPVVVADGTGLPAPYPLAELFLLPSHSENFGQAVAEALAAGVPALVTDTLPWRDLDAAGAGRCVPWADYPAALASLLDQPRRALAGIGASAREWVLERYTWESSARRLLAFYDTLAPAA
jgi:glycosyltransferase involved in cell wall biosynthesis